MPRSSVWQLAQLFDIQDEDQGLLWRMKDSTVVENDNIMQILSIY